MIDMVNSEAEFFISDKKIKLEDEEGNYIFWVAFINSENEENERSIRSMYGFTELLPGQITADTLISSDGNSYMDFLLNKFKIGNKKSSLDWNVNKDEQLSIKNANFEISNSEGEVISKIDGESGAAMFGKGTNLFDGLGNAVLGNLSHHFFADGNFNIAKNNLTYDESTNQLIISGKFESNKDGNKIVIDPITRQFVMYSKDGFEVFKLEFSEGFYLGKPYIIPRFTMNRYYNNEKTSYIQLDGESLKMYDQNSQFFGVDSVDGKIWIDYNRLRPRSQCHPFEVYADGENLKVYRA